MEHIKEALKNHLSQLETERERVIALLDIYGTNHITDDVSKTERYKAVIRELIPQQRSFHINDFQKEFKDRNIEWNKGLIHQVLRTLRESEEVIAIKINDSNQKYYYASWNAQSGGKYKIKDEYLPIAKEYIDSIELM